MTNDEVEFLEVGGGSRVQPGGVTLGSVFVLLEATSDIISKFVLPLQGQRDQLVSDTAVLLGHISHLSGTGKS